MRIYLFLAVIFVAFPLAAYEAGPSNRANFGSAQQQQPAQQGGYRSFSNYNNRSWGQGVQTKPVQTSLAGSASTEFAPVEKQSFVGKQAVKGAKPAAAKAAQASATPTQPSSGTAAMPSMPAGADPAAMLQQVQGMMQNMSGAANGQQPAAGNAASAMPAGMPDISALMGGMMPGGAPAATTTTPAKK